jgi:hypothetical protein
MRLVKDFDPNKIALISLNLNVGIAEEYKMYLEKFSP